MFRSLVHDITHPLIFIYFDWNKNQNIALFSNKMMKFEMIMYDNVKFMNFNIYLVSILIVCKKNDDDIFIIIIKYAKRREKTAQIA